MFGFYTIILVLSWAVLLTMGMLVHENARIPAKDKASLYLTYLLIFLSSAAEWCGLWLNGVAYVPAWALRIVKCMDYILTPMCGAIFVFHMHLRNAVEKTMYVVIITNTFLQLVTLPTNLMLMIDKRHHYHHGPLYPAYVFFCLCVILAVIIEFVIYGRAFRKKNRKSLYVIMVILLASLLVQEIVPDFRIAYLGMTCCGALLFIYYSEFSQLQTDDILTEQKIRLMLSQIKPQFLYNALGLIEELCDLDPKRAKEATRLFSKYLRGNMDAITADKLIPFEQELGHTKLYLELEKIRSEEELEIEYQIETTDFFIPPLSLEPIVENAVKHGIRKKTDGRGKVLIKTVEYEDKFCVCVIDNGVGFDAREHQFKMQTGKGEGRGGVPNVRTRIQQICKGAVDVTSIPGAGTIATIDIPKKRK